MAKKIALHFTLIKCLYSAIIELLHKGDTMKGIVLDNCEIRES